MSIIEKAVLYVNNYIEKHYNKPDIVDDEEALDKFLDKWVDDFTCDPNDNFVIETITDLMVAINYCINRNKICMLVNFNETVTLDSFTNSFLKHILIDKCVHKLY
jgi:hypothetical protein